MGKELRDQKQADKMKNMTFSVGLESEVEEI